MLQVTGKHKTRILASGLFHSKSFFSDIPPMKFISLIQPSHWLSIFCHNNRVNHNNGVNLVVTQNNYIPITKQYCVLTGKAKNPILSYSPWLRFCIIQICIWQVDCSLLKDLTRYEANLWNIPNFIANVSPMICIYELYIWTDQCEKSNKTMCL